VQQDNDLQGVVPSQPCGLHQAHVYMPVWDHFICMFHYSLTIIEVATSFGALKAPLSWFHGLDW
jgi:hypothetical protein